MSKLLYAVSALVIFISASAQAETKVPERILGKANAPITVLEYVSFTCSHCADFTNTVLPELEKKYIETGKVRFILVDFPLDGSSLKAALLARCMPEEQFYPFVKVLFSNMKQWATSTNVEQTLLQYAKLGGLSEEKGKTCLKNTGHMDAIVAKRKAAGDKYEIDSTPTFIINDGKEKVVGLRKAEEFGAIFDKLLNAKR